MLNQGNVLSGKLRALVLIAVLMLAPTAWAADSGNDPSWVEIIQEWFEGLLDEDSDSTDDDGGVVHIPGG